MNENNTLKKSDSQNEKLEITNIEIISINSGESFLTKNGGIVNISSNNNNNNVTSPMLLDAEESSNLSTKSINNSQSENMNENTNSSSISNNNLLLLLPSASQMEEDEYEKFGARPKKKLSSSNQMNSKSSLSSSASSSLSSLISQNSSAQTNTKSTCSSTSSSNSQKNYRINNYKSSNKSKSNKNGYLFSTNSKQMKTSLNNNVNSCNYYDLEYEEPEDSYDFNNKLKNMDPPLLPDDLSINNSNRQNLDDDCYITNEIIACPLCFKKINNDMETHFQLEHKEHECPLCGLLFDSELNLNQHLSLVHTDEMNVNKDLIDEKTNDWVRKTNEHVINNSILPPPAMNDEDNLLPTTSQNNIINKEEYICPVCQIKIHDQAWLEYHVDSHFNNNPSNDEDVACGSGVFDHNTLSQLKTNKSRTQSQSSLTANVDENFEYDQIMTLAECSMNDEISAGTSKSFDDDFCSNEIVLIDSSNQKTIEKTNKVVNLSDLRDYELALMLDKEEKEKLKKSNYIEEDFLKAQLLDREENETLKYKLMKENNENNHINDEDFAMDCDYQSDSEYAAQVEHEWLKQKYGMSDTKASAKAKFNLDSALKSNKIDHVTYEYEKQQIENWINSIYDNGSTCSSDLIQLISSLPLTKTVNKRMLCTYCDFYSSSYIDTGYGCGYRNTQMLLSSIRKDTELCNIIFNNNNKNMPSVTKIQQLIENAWQNGFDVLGKSQLGGSLKNTSKWIGATDVCAMFSYLKIKTELIDIFKPSDNQTIGSVLFKFVKEYFEKSSANNQYVHPIYLQHDGHSRTIVGIELGKSDNLLIFDPGANIKRIEAFKKNSIKSMNIFRRGINAFKKKEYQLLIIKGVLNQQEYEKSKVLQSKRISS